MIHAKAGRAPVVRVFFGHRVTLPTRRTINISHNKVNNKVNNKEGGGWNEICASNMEITEKTESVS